mmetsp:Transcript_9362/g.19904  ORF Transcript_9362/g.19904 Transcript_9362/m.19904 type:complete len:212 (+) Transcript_9362:964-1599(+)
MNTGAMPPQVPPQIQNTKMRRQQQQQQQRMSMMMLLLLYTTQIIMATTTKPQPGSAENCEPTVEYAAPRNTCNVVRTREIYKLDGCVVARVNQQQRRTTRARSSLNPYFWTRGSRPRHRQQQVSSTSRTMIIIHHSSSGNQCPPSTDLRGQLPCYCCRIIRTTTTARRMTMATTLMMMVVVIMISRRCCREETISPNRLDRTVHRGHRTMI